MKKLLLTLFAIAATVNGFAAVGDVFTYGTSPSVRYRVLTEDATSKTGTVQVYSSYWESPSISKTYSGAVVVPESFEYEGFTYVVTNVGKDAFHACALTSIELPKTVVSWGEAAFKDCSSLTEVYITDLEAWLNAPFSTTYANPLCNGADLYLNGEKVVDLEIPSGVLAVKARAFRGCKSIESLKVSSDCTSLAAYSFENCVNLSSVTIPYGISLGENVFYNSTLISEVNLIGDEGDTYDSILRGWISRSFESLQANPLAQGAKLYIDGTELKELEVPIGVKVGKYALRGCTSLESLSFADGCKSVSDYAFAKCTNLKTINFPSSMTSLGSMSFTECTGVEDVYLNCAPFKLNSYLFGPRTDASSAMNRAVFHVADFNNLAAYNSRDIWKSNLNYSAELNDDKVTTYTGTTSFTKTTGNIVVTYKRSATLKKGVWQAWFMPFNAPYSELAAQGLEVVKFTDAALKTPISDGALDLEFQYVASTATLKANYPYLIRAKSKDINEISVTITKMESCGGGEISLTTGNCTLVGLYSPKVIGTDADYRWAMAGGKLCQAKTTATLTPFRWYLEISNEYATGQGYVGPTTEAQAQSLAREVVVLDANEDEEEDVVDGIYSVSVNNRLQDNSAWHNLAGQRVERPTKGVYIKGGKKVLF